MNNILKLSLLSLLIVSGQCTDASSKITPQFSNPDDLKLCEHNGNFTTWRNDKMKLTITRSSFEDFVAYTTERDNEEYIYEIHLINNCVRASMKISRDSAKSAATPPFRTVRDCRDYAEKIGFPKEITIAR